MAAVPIVVRYGAKVRVGHAEVDSGDDFAAIRAVVRRAAGIPPEYQRLEWCPREGGDAHHSGAAPMPGGAPRQPEDDVALQCGVHQTPSARRLARAAGVSTSRRRIASPPPDTPAEDNDFDGAGDASVPRVLSSPGDAEAVLACAEEAHRLGDVPPTVFVHVVSVRGAAASDRAFFARVAEEFDRRSDLLQAAASAAPVPAADMGELRRLLALPPLDHVADGEAEAALQASRGGVPLPRAAADPSAVRSEPVTRDEARAIADAVRRRVASRRAQRRGDESASVLASTGRRRAPPVLSNAGADGEGSSGVYSPSPAAASPASPGPLTVEIAPARSRAFEHPSATPRAREHSPPRPTYVTSASARDAPATSPPTQSRYHHAGAAASPSPVERPEVSVANTSLAGVSPIRRGTPRRLQAPPP